MTSVLKHTVVLIGNYLPDRQESMQRYQETLARELVLRGVRVVVLRPEAHLGTISSHVGISKWLGYVDKFVIFPRRLRRVLAEIKRSGERVLVHVCDHSNSRYVRSLGGYPHVVTCHDMLAIRMALAGIPGQAGTRFTGRIFQRIIRDGLNRAQEVVCVSEQTRRELLEHTTQSPERVHRIYNGLNHPYRPMPREQAQVLAGAAFARAGLALPEKFLLHVGSDVWYKNRDGLVRIYKRLRELRGDVPPLVLLGKAPAPDLARQIENSGCASEVLCITDATNEELNACYALAEAFVFPSLAEGYGWPIAEAMACGCRVITTSRDPMTEVGGTVAAYASPEDVDGFARAVGALLDETSVVRAERVKRGLARAVEFSTATMVDAYLERYRSVSLRDATQVKS
jgi:glycosyltransferase involved in cell wall biosynthesis